MERYGVQSRKNTLSVAAATALLSLVIPITFFQIPNVSDISDYLILLGLAAVIIVSLIMNAAVNGLDIFEPINIIALTYLQVFVVAPWVWLAQGRTSWFGYPLMHNLMRGSLFFLFGYLAFFVGYCLQGKSKKHKPEKVYLFDERRRQLVCKIAVVMMTAALLGSVLNTYSMGKSLIFTLTLGRVTGEGFINLSGNGSDNMQFWGMFINLLVPAFMLLYAFQKKHRWLLVPAFVFALLFNIAAGFRYRVLLLVFAPVLYNYLKNNKRPKLLLITVLVVIVFVIVTVIGAWRGGIRSGSELISLNWDLLLKSYMPNVEIFSTFYRILDVVPQSYPYSLGRGYLYAFTIMIPRALWPGKPYPPMREIFTLAFGKLGMLSGPAYPNIGELYVEFGFIGILVGMLLFGYFARWTASLSIKKNSSIFSQINYAMLFPYFLQIVCRGYFPQIFTESLFTFGPIIAAAYFSSRILKTRVTSL